MQIPIVIEDRYQNTPPNQAHPSQFQCKLNQMTSSHFDSNPLITNEQLDAAGRK